MTKSDLRAYVEEQINQAARRIIDKGTTSDDLAVSRLNVLLSLRRTLDSKTTNEDLAVWGTVNDVLQQIGILSGKETIFTRLQA
ncbi:hypothetical protein FCH79_09055 [Pseudomonas koreensis]|uniref:hypothetical protein n=1 Tax=Pseudomonas TaxID=286 RepID=UPI00059765FC|nr:MULTISPECIES: hypothetical protein [Pseudomonas]KIK89417.1 hypothetical protein OC71_03400 [Pseudomonas sp. W15Feb9B]NTZ95465.1 hypothetical protein [Pseudomonas koreensis]